MSKVLVNFVSTLLSIFYGASLLFSPRGRVHFFERLGIWGKLPHEFIWIHGASVGEISGLGPIAKGLRSFTNLPILTTVTSSTALSKAEEFSDFSRILFLDAFPWIYFALRGRRPKLIIVGEREFWPVLFQWLGANGIPIVKVNALISEKSAKKVSTYKVLFGGAISAISKVCAVDDVSAQRFRLIGIDRAKIVVTGNVKYDREPLEIQKHPRPLFVFGNIRPGEEELLFPVLREICASTLSFDIAIVPRHEEKFSYFEEKLREHQVIFGKYSKGGLGDGITLVDAFGVLEELYAKSKLAFIGGTLCDYGGHNPLEPAPYNVCVAIGPYTESIGDLRSLMINAGAVIEIDSKNGLRELLLRFANQDSELGVYGQRLYSFWAGNRNSLVRTLKEISEVLR